MGKDDPIGRPDPFAQKVIKVAGVSSDAPQVSLVKEFTPSVEEIQSALGLSSQEATAGSSSGAREVAAEKSKGPATSGTLNGENPTPGSGIANGKAPTANSSRLQAGNIVSEAGQKRNLSPASKERNTGGARRVSRRSTGSTGPRRVITRRSLSNAGARPSTPAAAALSRSDGKAQATGSSAHALDKSRSKTNADTSSSKTNLQREAELGLACIRCKAQGTIAVTTLAGRKIGRCSRCKHASTPEELQAMVRKAEQNNPAAFCQAKLQTAAAPPAQQLQSQAPKEPSSANAGDEIILITRDEWNALLRKVEVLQRDSEAKTQKIKALDTVLSGLREENQALKQTTAERGAPRSSGIAESHREHPVRALEPPPPVKQVQNASIPGGTESAEACHDETTTGASYLKAAKTNWSPDVQRRLLEARAAMIKANLIRQRKLTIRAYYFRNVQRGKMSELRSILAKILPYECRVGISFIGGSIIELLADARTADRIDLMERLRFLRWRPVVDYEIFNDSLKKSATDLPGSLRTLKNLEMVRHRMALCLKYARHPDAEEWYKARKAEAERRIAALPPLTEDEGAANETLARKDDIDMVTAKPNVPLTDEDGFTSVVRKKVQSQDALNNVSCE